MTYIALGLTTIMTIWFAVAHEEQKLKAEKYRLLSLRLKKENDALKDTDTMEEFERLVTKCFYK